MNNSNDNNTKKEWKGNEFRDELNKEENESSLLKFLLIERKGKEERKQFVDATFINFKEEGISICLDKKTQKIDCIFLYSPYNKDKFSSYEGELPFELNWKMTNKEIVQKFGEPEGKPKASERTHIFVDYQKLGLQIDFLSNDYNNSSNQMTCVCIYPSK
eukprot:TRINITY_DN5034_c0_g1_i2.p2 TRINITY_DN5034_c0_g1~~TRINITY_DN5034_c0_g1_i2.p2  ORF type:complete len:169 (+),score=79.36 TRINITY_DN5034_c0_g1_i2:29-508(+)